MKTQVLELPTRFVSDGSGLHNSVGRSPVVSIEGADAVTDMNGTVAMLLSAQSGLRSREIIL